MEVRERRGRHSIGTHCGSLSFAKCYLRRRQERRFDAHWVTVDINIIFSYEGTRKFLSAL